MRTLLFALVSSIFIAQASAKTCTVCLEVDKINQIYEEDHSKGYEAFNQFLAQVKLSKDKHILDKELESILKATVTIIENDDRQELADYLADMQSKNPKSFKAALGKLSAEQKTDLENRIKIASDLIKNGEEP